MIAATAWSDVFLILGILSIVAVAHRLDGDP